MLKAPTGSLCRRWGSAATSGLAAARFDIFPDAGYEERNPGGPWHIHSRPIAMPALPSFCPLPVLNPATCHPFPSSPHEPNALVISSRVHMYVVFTMYCRLPRCKRRAHLTLMHIRLPAFAGATRTAGSVGLMALGIHIGPRPHLREASLSFDLNFQRRGIQVKVRGKIRIGHSAGALCNP